MDVLKNIDFFGTSFNFYVENNRKYYNYIGGIFTIISILLYIMLILFLSKNDFQKKSPQIFSFSLPKDKENDSSNNLETKEIWIPIRIVSNEGNIINKLNVFPTVYYDFENLTRSLKIEKSNVDNNDLNKLNDNNTFQVKKCYETSFMNIKNKINIDINIPINDLLCLDLNTIYSKYELFVSQNVIINYVNIDFFLCSNVYNNNFNYSCSNNLLYNNNEIWYLEMYYPTLQINANDKKAPMKTEYKKFFHILDTNINKIDNIFLQENIFKDDNKLFSFTQKKINSLWNINLLNSDYSYQNENEKNKKHSINYSIKLNISSEKIYYIRRYKKFYEIFGEIFSLIFFIHLTIKELIKSIKIPFINQKLSALFFEKLQEKPNKFKQFFENLKQNSKKFKTLNKKDDKKPGGEATLIRAKTYKENSSSLYFVSYFNEKYIDRPSKKNDETNNIKQRVISDNIKKNKNLCQEKMIGSEKKNNSKISYDYFKVHSFKQKKGVIPSIKNEKFFISVEIFPFKYYFCNYLFKILPNEKFSKVDYIMKKSFDIESYLEMFRQFNVIKNVFINSENENRNNEKEKENKEGVGERGVNNEKVTNIINNNNNLLLMNKKIDIEDDLVINEINDYDVDNIFDLNNVFYKNYLNKVQKKQK